MKGLKSILTFGNTRRLVQDDFLMGRERDNGQVYFVGGVVAHPGSFVAPIPSRYLFSVPLLIRHCLLPQTQDSMISGQK